MADYISREVAIEAVRCYQVINDSYSIYDDGYNDAIDMAMLGLSEIPADDVRPVVLCRDCKHFNPYPGDCTDGEIEGVCKRHNSIGVLVMDEDFCSDAERI